MCEKVISVKSKIDLAKREIEAKERLYIKIRIMNLLVNILVVTVHEV